MSTPLPHHIYAAQDLTGITEPPAHPLPTAPEVGHLLGVAYWQAAVKDTPLSPHHLRLDVGANPAAAHEALSAGFHVAFCDTHPAFSRLHALAKDLSLTCENASKAHSIFHKAPLAQPSPEPPLRHSGERP